MSVLLLRLVGSMQSWGIQSKFSHRDTQIEPTKSGIIGLICSALGRDRSETVDDIADLKMIVRVDKEGIPEKDYQTATNIYQANGEGLKKSTTSNRYYLSDAEFIVGLSGDGELLKEIHKSLENPYWDISLGKKAFLPSLPVYLQDGFFENGDLLEILKNYSYNGDSIKTRFVIETTDQSGEVRNDQPIGASFKTREFVFRYVITRYFDISIKKE